jgi:C_GCAxxG_C_C family probable redox protein
MNINIAERKEKAVNFFNEGYNCAQSVFLAYSDVYGIDDELAKKISVSFGGGMGRLRETCGAVSAMAIIAGFEHPAGNPGDQQAKTTNYAAVQSMVNQFKEKFGTINCGELLRIPVSKDPAPSERTPEYYAKRPCARFVSYAAEIIGKHLQENNPQ